MELFLIQQLGLLEFRRLVVQTLVILEIGLSAVFAGPGT